jgi:hypothetical protein
MMVFRMRCSDGRVDRIRWTRADFSVGRLLRASFAHFVVLFVALSSVSDAQVPPLKNKMDEKGLVYVAAKRGCTQEDAPALEIYFTRAQYNGVGDAEPPYLRFEISSSPRETLTAGSYVLSGLRREEGKTGRIVRGELVRTEHDMVWLTGTIELEEAVPGKQVRGRYDVRAPGGPRLINSFRAEYSSNIALCG